MPDWRVIQGHVLDVLPSIEEESVQVCVTSPPYFGLRSYGTTPQIWGGDSSCKHDWRPQQYELQKHGDNGSGENLEGSTATQKQTRIGSVESAFCHKCDAWRGSLGLEPTVERYVQNIVEVFRKVWRVLRKDGSLWIVLGDNYATSPPGNRPNTSKDSSGLPNSRKNLEMKRAAQAHKKDYGHLKPKDLIGIPWILAMALRADGYYLREEIIWWKPGCQPDSVNGWRWERHQVKVGEKDGENVYADCDGCDKCDAHQGWVLRKGSWRCTRSHEYLLHLTKSGEAYSDKYAAIERSSGRSSGNKQARLGDNYGRPAHHVRKGFPYDSDGWRNKRSVWRIPTEPSGLEHYAAFPRKLIRDPILASTSEAGQCRKCGSPWARIIDRTRTPRGEPYQGKQRLATKRGRTRRLQAAEAGARAAGGDHDNPFKTPKTLGWRPTCECGLDDPVPQIVCDPFVGSGVSGVVAVTLGRSFIGIDLNSTYCTMARKRIREAAPLFAKEEGG